MEHSLEEALPQEFGAPPRYPIESVDNALRMISLFCSRGQVRVREVADMLGLSTGSAHRLLAALVYRGFASQDPVTKLYTHGPILLSIGLRATARMNLREAAGPYLDELNTRFDETVYLATLEGANVLYLDGKESTKSLRVASRTGTLQPAHLTSVGKAMLAVLPAERVITLYPEEELPQRTPRSVSSRSQLLLELDDVRRGGYAVNFGEFEPGISSVAVPVQLEQNRPVAAIGIGAPMLRVDDQQIRVIAEAITEAAARLAANIAAD